MGSSWWGEPVVEWAAIVVVVVVPIWWERWVLSWEWWGRRWSASAMGSSNCLDTLSLFSFLYFFVPSFNWKVLGWVETLAFSFFVNVITWSGIVSTGSHSCSACLVVECVTLPSVLG